MNNPVFNSERERIESALSYVPADERELWVRIGMAVKAELGDDGKELWFEWSRQSDNFNHRAAESVWKSILYSGGITIGTLFAEAKNRGWKNGQTPRRPAEEVARERKKRAELAQREHQKRITDARFAAANARSLLKRARLSPHRYLANKGFPDTYGFVHHGRLLIPLADYDSGIVVGIQSISPDGSKKNIPPGCDISNAVVRIGQQKRERMLWWCEGYATGISIWNALKYLYRFDDCVISCLSDWKLANISKRIGRGVVVADNDSLKSSAGMKAAKRSGLPWCMPPEYGDANDYAMNHGYVALAELLRPYTIIQ